MQHRITALTQEEPRIQILLFQLQVQILITLRGDVCVQSLLDDEWKQQAQGTANKHVPYQMKSPYSEVHLLLITFALRHGSLSSWKQQVK